MASFPILLILAGFLAHFTNGDSLSQNVTPGIQYSLPRQVIPTHYKVEIQPFLEDSPYGIVNTANGKITISVRCLEPTSSITLHALELEINFQSIKVVEKVSQIPVELSSENIDQERQFYIIETGSPLMIDTEYEIYIEYKAQIPANVFYGIYQSSYKDENGNSVKIAAVHFEPTHARRAFPIFDEPNFKAVWEMSILRLNKHNSLANMDLNRQENVDGMTGWTRDIFNPTPAMSSYLICFLVSDYTLKEADLGLFRVPVKVWASTPLVNEGAADYSPNYAAKVLNYFEEYFQVPFAYPKMDKVAIKDFAIGAMENGGLNTYRESRLLWLAGDSPISDLIATSSTVAHEISHDHFGNRVTPFWWDDTWLKEGFATYFAPLAADVFHPEYNLKNSMVNNVVQRAMQFDSSPSTHPMHNEVNTPQDISRHFSSISYQKAGAVILMMNTFLGEDTFRGALTVYLEAFSFFNAKQDQLFDKIQEKVDENGIDLGGSTVTQIMNTWTLQSGFPFIRVKRDMINPGRITVQQEEFRLNSEEIPSEPKSWIVPIFLINEVNRTHPRTYWLSTNQVEEVVDTGIDDNIKWILVNPAHRGYYRVLYDEYSLKMLHYQLLSDYTKIDQLSRSALIDDSINLAMAGFMDLTQALEVTKYLNNEMNLVPWTSFLTNMEIPYKMLLRSPAFHSFRKWMLGLIKPPLNSLGYELRNSDFNQIGDNIILRASLSKWACQLGDESCSAFAKQSLDLWKENPLNSSLIYPDMQPMVFCYGVSRDNDASEFILSQYETFDRFLLPEVMTSNLIRALGCSKDSYALNKLLTLTVDLNSPIKSEHKLTVIQAIAENSIGPDLIFNFMRNNLDLLIRRFDANFVASIASTLSSQFNSLLDLQDMQNFYEKNREVLGGVQASFETSFENIKKNNDWMEKNYLKFTTWLATL